MLYMLHRQSVILKNIDDQYIKSFDMSDKIAQNRDILCKGGNDIDSFMVRLLIYGYFIANHLFCDQYWC